MRIFKWIVVLLALCVAREARANIFAFKLGAGVNFPAGSVNGPLTTGGTFIIGAGVRPIDRLTVLADYTYSGNSIDQNHIFHTVNSAVTQSLIGLQSMHIFEITGRYAVYNTAPVSVGLNLSPGLYYRHVSIDQVVGTGVATFCDPFLFFCAPTAVPITQEIGTRTAWDFGLAAPADISMVSEGVVPYFEVRVERIFGGSFTDASGAKRSTSATFIPLSVGIRYQ